MTQNVQTMSKSDAIIVKKDAIFKPVPVSIPVSILKLFYQLFWYVELLLKYRVSKNRRIFL